MEPRLSWSFDRSPRIISKYFSGEGGFFADTEASYVPSTGFAWFPKPALTDNIAEDFPLSRILLAYVTLFNSQAFSRILQFYAPHVSGGQYDLSPRYVNDVPLPNFSELLVDPVQGDQVRNLARLAQADDVAKRQRDALLTELYGTQIS